MNNIECETCVKRKTMFCPNSIKCYATKDKPFWQNRIMLLEENQQLKEEKATFELAFTLTKQKLEEIKDYIEKHSRDSEIKIHGLPDCKIFTGSVEDLQSIIERNNNGNKK